MRLLAHYDSSQSRVLTDFLASYEFVPGTVFHAGYGCSVRKDSGGGAGARWVNPAESDTRYLMINRGLFLKASYLRRF